MNLQILAQNILRLRVAKQLSQTALAEAANISISAIKSLELAKAAPRMRTLQAIAKALDVRIQDVFLPFKELRTVRFRSAKRMQNREKVLADVAMWLEDFNSLEKILNRQLPFDLKPIRAQCSRNDVMEAARLCRKTLKLKPTEPIHDICGLLERTGVKVLPMQMSSDSFFGLSVGEGDGGPAVVVNVWERIAIERRIFTAAHELGHLILHPEAYKVDQVDENKEEEQEANRFSSYFLMPNEGFYKEWNEAAGLHFVDRVLKVKLIFRVSYKSILSRLLEDGVVDKSIWMKFNIAFQRRFNRKLPFKEEPMGIDIFEPFGMQRFDFSEDRFSLLVREALDDDKISLSRGAEILRIGIEEMRDLRQNWEAIL
jgi:Zn-dependent peptidase ImmA (M78 family)/DNA-binding XRE family transcriptional regulator